MQYNKACINSELRFTIDILRRAGFRPRIIHQTLTDAGESISLRYVYVLYSRGQS